MSSTIFLVGGDNQLRSLTRTGFSSEDVFQSLLADHPALLGLAANDRAPLLVRREQPIADSEGGSARWSLDHLYVDREGVPILVEVKRASDTRLRREVVGQMLDYAANGVAYWPIADIVQAFGRTCAERGQDSEVELEKFLGSGQDVESFWRAVDANLRAGRIRLIFVADRIPKELQRIIEFLNEQLQKAEVLAVELEQYSAQDGTRTLVPKLIGQTERARATKSVGSATPKVSTEEWLSQLSANSGDSAFRGASRVIEWLTGLGCEVGPTKSGDALYVKVLDADGGRAWPFFVRSNGHFETSLQYLESRPAFAAEQARRALLDRLSSIPGIELTSTGKLTGWPWFPLAKLLNDDVWAAFQDVARDVVEASKRTS